MAEWHETELGRLRELVWSVERKNSHGPYWPCTSPWGKFNGVRALPCRPAAVRGLAASSRRAWEERHGAGRAVPGQHLLLGRPGHQRRAGGQGVLRRVARLGVRRPGDG